MVAQRKCLITRHMYEAAHEITKFEKFHLLVWTIFCVELKLAYLGVRKK